MNNQTVIGVFDTQRQARSAKDALIKAGFTASGIDLSAYGEHGTRSEKYHDNDDNAIERFFENLFGDDHDRRKVGREVASRGTVVTVHATDMTKAKQAAAILDRFGSIDMDDRYQQYQNKSFDADANRNRLNQRFGEVDADGIIEVVKEDIAVGKREVETGGVTVRSHIIERPVEETLRLRREEVFVNRRAVDRPATGADFRDKTISVKETAEEAVVAKTARVVEEIEVGKTADTRTETIHETARETEVDVVQTEGERVRKHEKGDAKLS